MNISTLLMAGLGLVLGAVLWAVGTFKFQGGDYFATSITIIRPILVALKKSSFIHLGNDSGSRRRLSYVHELT